VSLQGQVVFLTGGARGIGADAARRLVERGARVALVDRDAAGVERRVRELGDGVAVGFAADVTDVRALEETVSGTLARFGRIDVTVANAGILGEAATLGAVDPEGFERVIEVNLLGVWRTIRATLPHVVERRGYVLPIASIAAAVPIPLLSAYGASKAGVEALGLALRMELAHTGTRVGVGYFGIVDTDLARDGFGQPAVAHVRAALPKLVDRPIPVGAAGAAVVRGIERRAKRVYAPRWVPALLAVRGVQGPATDILARRRRFVEACRIGAGAAGEAPLTSAGAPGRAEPGGSER
jgi:NAD(P)-dependent dehydrogenase (short-subunit alcohol dehydrogenase family)